MVLELCLGDPQKLLGHLAVHGARKVVERGDDVLRGSGPLVIQLRQLHLRPLRLLSKCPREPTVQLVDLGGAKVHHLAQPRHERLELCRHNAGESAGIGGRGGGGRAGERRRRRE